MVILYQIFDAEKFLGTRKALDGESKEDTKQRLIKDFKYDEDIAIFFVNYVE